MLAPLLREPKQGGDALNKWFSKPFVAKAVNKLCLEPARSDLEPLGYFSKKSS